MTHLFRVKSLDRLKRESEAPDHRLKRALGPVQLTSLGIGAIIGAGFSRRSARRPRAARITWAPDRRWCSRSC